MCRTESRQHENCQFRKIHTCDDHNFRPKTLSNRFEKAAAVRNKFIPWVMIVLGFGGSIFVYTLAFTEIRVCWYVSTFDHNFFSSLLVYISTHLVHPWLAATTTGELVLGGDREINVSVFPPQVLNRPWFNLPIDLLLEVSEITPDSGYRVWCLVYFLRQDVSEKKQSSAFIQDNMFLLRG